MAQGLIDVLNALGSLFRFGILPLYSDWLIQVMAAAFAGSGSAGVLVIYFRERIREIPLLFCRDHVILCGTDETAEALVRQFREREVKTVVIAGEKDAQAMENIRRSCTVLLSGDPKDPGVLSRARVKKASTLLALTGSDGQNAEIVLSAMKIRREGDGDGKPLACVLQVSDPALWRLIREQALLPGKDQSVRIDFYNGPALSAQDLIREYFLPRIRERPDPPPLLVVAGAGSLAGYLLAGAARAWYELGRGETRLEVILVDPRAEEERERLLLTYPRLPAAATIHAVPSDTRSPAFQSGRFLGAAGPFSFALAFICLDSDEEGLAAGLALSRHLSGQDARVLVRMDHNPGLAALLGEESPGMVPLVPYSSLSRAARPEIVLGGVREVLARAIHDQYRERMANQGTVEKSPALVPWDELSDRLKESSRLQAGDILAKLHAIGCDIQPMTDWDAPSFSFSPEEIEYLAAMEHQRWMDAMVADGYSHGPVRDDAARKHPAMVPYADLPEPEKEKDRDAARMIPRYLALIDMQVYRRKKGAAGVQAPGGG